MSGKPTGRRSKTERPSRGRADLARLSAQSESEITTSSPPELRDLPEDFWDEAVVVDPPPKEAISIRVDQDVLNWFRRQGPRYQTRINAVLRSYMRAAEKRQG